MTLQEQSDHRPADPAATSIGSPDEAPENLPPKAWVTLILFAAFIVAAGGCGIVHLLG